MHVNLLRLLYNQFLLSQPQFSFGHMNILLFALRAHTLRDALWAYQLPLSPTHRDALQDTSERNHTDAGSS